MVCKDCCKVSDGKFHGKQWFFLSEQGDFPADGLYDPFWEEDRNHSKHIRGNTLKCLWKHTIAVLGTNDNATAAPMLRPMTMISAGATCNTSGNQRVRSSFGVQEPLICGVSSSCFVYCIFHIKMVMSVYKGVSINRGTPIFCFRIEESIKMDALGVPPFYHFRVIPDLSDIAKARISSCLQALLENGMRI